MPRHLLTVADLSAGELAELVDRATRPSLGTPLTGRGVAMIFEKPSNRTRQSTEMAVVQLGGHPVYTRGEEIGFDSREPVEDVTRVMAGYHAVLTARVFDHAVLRRMAAVDAIPVVNLLSDWSHPLQALADVVTMRQVHGSLAGLAVAWVGDYNNVARSLAEACVLLGADIALAAPTGYGPAEHEVERLRLLGSGTVRVVTRAVDAVRGALAVHTDTWTSMGQEAEKGTRAQAFEAFRVDEPLMAHADPAAGFYHCLPAYRGQEVSAAVIDGPRSHVIAQSHRRLDAARAVLSFVIEES